MHGIKELGERIALFYDKCVESKTKEELLTQGQLGNKLSNKHDKLEQDLEKAREERVNAALEICENRVEDMSTR